MDSLYSGTDASVKVVDDEPMDHIYISDCRPD